MSHELRTPLNAVIGYSEYLLEDSASDGSGAERIAELRRIHTAGRHSCRWSTTCSTSPRSKPGAWM